MPYLSPRWLNATEPTVTSAPAVLAMGSIHSRGRIAYVVTKLLASTPLEESAIEIRDDQPLANVEERTLREHRLGGPEAVEDHLPAKIESNESSTARCAADQSI